METLNNIHETKKLSKMSSMFPAAHSHWQIVCLRRKYAQLSPQTWLRDAFFKPRPNCRLRAVLPWETAASKPDPQHGHSWCRELEGWGSPSDSVLETPQSRRGQPIVCLVYPLAVRSQSKHRPCSSTATAEVTTGSNTPSTDSTDHRVTMQHKSGAVLILD